MSKKFVLILVVAVLVLVGLVLAQSGGLEDELAGLILELEDSGYGWLVDYSEEDLVSDVRIEIYEVDGSEVIASFESLVDEELNKVYLEGLVGEQDVFDLLILGGDLVFDWIVDPKFPYPDPSGWVPVVNEGIYCAGSGGACEKAGYEGSCKGVGTEISNPVDGYYFASASGFFCVRSDDTFGCSDSLTLKGDVCTSGLYRYGTEWAWCKCGCYEDEICDECTDYEGCCYVHSAEQEHYAINTSTGNWYCTDSSYSDCSTYDGRQCHEDGEGSDGTCVSDDGDGDYCDRTGEVAMYCGTDCVPDGDIAYSDCSGHGGYSCMASAGGEFEQDGTCVSDGSCDIDDCVASDDGSSNFYSECSSGNVCDSSVVGGDFDRDGFCGGGECCTDGMNISSGECGSIYGGDCGGSADWDGGDESCGCDSNNEGEICDRTPLSGPVGEGVCVEDVCDIGAVSVNCGSSSCTYEDLIDEKMDGNCSVWYGFACDYDVEGDGFVQDGICAEGAPRACNVEGFVCRGSGGRHAADEVSSTYCVEGDLCDSSLTDGNFNAGSQRYDDDDEGSCDACDNGLIGDNDKCEGACGAATECDEEFPFAYWGGSGGGWCYDPEGCGSFCSLDSLDEVVDEDNDEVFDMDSSESCNCDSDDATNPNPKLCDHDFDGAANGVCVLKNDSSNFDCDSGEVCFGGAYYENDCKYCNTGNACDSGVMSAGIGFIQDGSCIGETCCSSITYGDNLTDIMPDDGCSASASLGRTCDGTPENGISLEGITSEISIRECCTTLSYGSDETDGTPFENCSSSCLEGRTCINITRDLQPDGITEDEEGLCVVEGYCELGAVCKDGIEYHSDFTQCQGSQPCDNDINANGDGFVRRGSVVMDACCVLNSVASGEYNNSNVGWDDGNEECGCPGNDGEICDKTPADGLTPDGICSGGYCYQPSDGEDIVDTDQDGTFDTFRCRAATTQGDQCDSLDDGLDGFADGVCVDDVCDIVVPMSLNCGIDGCSPADEGASASESCSGISGWSCDSSYPPFPDNYFTQDGICTSEGCTTGSSEVCFDDVNYQSGCSSCSGGNGCTLDLLTGDYEVEGICLSYDGCDNVGEAAKDCNYSDLEDCGNYYSGCDDPAVEDNDRCDTSIVDGEFEVGEGVCSGDVCVECVEETNCEDGIDNDCDGAVDYDDFDSCLPTVVLVSPVDDSYLTDRTPTFMWIGSGDILGYKVSIVAVGGCADTRIPFVDYPTEEFTPTLDLACLNDNGYHYEWKVSATNDPLYFTDPDNAEWGLWSETWELYIDAVVGIKFKNDHDAIDFGVILHDGSVDTTGLHAPFVLENDGTVIVDVDVIATDLWTVQGAENPSEYYLLWVSENEAGSYDSGSAPQWTQMPDTTSPILDLVAGLKYNDDNDEAQVDIRVVAPPGEPGGEQRSSTITFTANLGE